MAGDETPRFDVLILGASFAGVELVYQLRKRGGAGLRIAVIDRQAEHGYIPLVQERLVERIPPERTALQTRAYVESRPGARYVVGEVVSFDPEVREVALASGERLRGGIVVVALGSSLAPPPRLPGAERFAGYKFGAELAASRTDLAQALGGQGGAEHPTIAVAGGGISGVELAGELGHLAQARPAGWRAPRVVLVQGGERLLPEITARAADKAARYLRRQGVEVRLRTRLVELGAGTATLRAEGGSDEILPCALAFWAGGVRPAPALGALGLSLTPQGWLRVGPTLQCFPEDAGAKAGIFAIGDAVRITDGSGEWPTMQRAIECLWQAKLCARNLLALANSSGGTPRLRFHTLRREFPYGVSVGAESLFVYKGLVLDLGAFNIWFRRFLMRQYFRRYQ